ncbi:MAG: hypothetical protein OEL53_15580 [Rhodospirillales bacterium]|nr:hypothetical protein [Rhodospirillales bacterium]
MWQLYHDCKNLIIALLTFAAAAIGAVVFIAQSKGAKKSEEDLHRRSLETVETLVRIARECDGSDADRLGHVNSSLRSENDQLRKEYQGVVSAFLRPSEATRIKPAPVSDKRWSFSPRKA